MKCLSEVVAVDPSILARVKKKTPTMHISPLKYIFISFSEFLFLLFFLAGYATRSSWAANG